MKLFTNKADIVAAITSISGRGARLDKDIQKAAVSVMAHHAEHGDVTLINELVAAMPKGARVNALRDFILAHGKVQFDADSKSFTHNRDGSFDLEGALSVLWTEFKPEAEYKPIDVLVLIEKLAKRVAKADVALGDKVNAEQLLAVMSLAASMGIVLEA